jgi:hypothetical protein
MHLALQLIESRARVGDSTALDEYAEWLSGLNEEQENGVGNPFTLMIAHPEHPAVARAARTLFGDRKSPYRPALVDGNFTRSSSWTSGLLQFPDFRAAVLELLGAKAAVGRVEINEQSLTIQWPNGSHGQNLQGTDAPVLYEGPFRACDYVAYRLSAEIAAAPRCELYWPEAKRDAAVVATVAFLEAYGRRASNADSGCGLTFPLRDRPATRDEARRRDAIFSLDGEGPARAVKLPWAPRAAEWVTLHEVPIEVTHYHNGKYVSEKGFLQNGMVWQAEEVEVGGRWRRYYGFAGAHQVARVPAEEVEFPAAGGYPRWQRYAGKFEARLAPPTGTIDPDEPGPPRRVLGEPMPLSVWVQNAGGLPAEVPALPGGLRLRAWYSPEVIAPQGMLTPAAKSKEAWQELTAKAGAEFPKVAGLSLEAAMEMSTGDLDLSAWFDVSKPGFYRVMLTAPDADEDGVGVVEFSLGAPVGR